MLNQELNRVKQLLATYSKEEIKLSLRYIDHLEVDNRKKKNKIYLVLTYILDDISISEKQLLEHFYPKTPFIKAELHLDRLLRLLRNKLLEALLTDVGVKKSRYVASSEVEAACKKLFMKYQVVVGKGVDGLAFLFLKQLITLAKKNELYNDLVEALYLQQKHLNLRKKKSQYEKNEQEALFYSKCLNACRQAQNYRQQWNQEVRFTKNRTQRVQFFKNVIRRCKRLYKETQSKRVLFDLFFLQMELYQHQQDYKLSNKYCQQLLLLIKENTFLYKKRHEGGIRMNMAYNSLWLGDFQQTERHLNNAQQFFSQHGHNSKLLNEVSFYLYYMQGKQQKVHELARHHVLSFSKRTNDFTYSKWHYWLACTYFNNRNYKKALHLLNNCPELARDHLGWELSIQVLRIVIYMELQNHDTAEVEINHLQKLYNKPTLSARNKTILRILVSMADLGFTFRKTYQENKKDFDKLYRAKGWYKWKVQTPELFLFDEWFLSKLEDRSYAPDYERLLR